MGAAPEAAPQRSRRSRVLQRTWIGLAMVAVAAGLIGVLVEVGDRRPLLIVMTLFALVASREVGRMGRVARRGYGFLVAAAAAVVSHGLWVWEPSAAIARELGRQAFLALEAGCLVLIGLGLLQRRGVRDFLPQALVSIALVAAWFVGAPQMTREPFARALPFVLVAIPLLAFLALPRWQPGGLDRPTHFALAAFLIVWVAPPLVCTVLVYESYAVKGLLALLLLSKIGDVAGYYVGNAIGRSHPFPQLSPGKTTEGCLGSLFAGTLAGALVVATGLLPMPTWGYAGALLLGGVTNVAAQAGDLLESGVKRFTQVKDSGPWFGPAGGVLDLLDSLLLTVPTAALLWPFLTG